MGETRRTQAERRNETQAAVLDSACYLFGKKGYNKTSLEDIASHCKLTIRPIYHYFGNKKQLFAAVNEKMESRILSAFHQDKATGDKQNPLYGWHAFLDLCSSREFRQIVLIDSPNILGRERWKTSAVVIDAKKRLRGIFKDKSGYKAELLSRMMIGAFAEAGLSIAESDDPEHARQQANEIVNSILNKFAPH